MSSNRRKFLQNLTKVSVVGLAAKGVMAKEVCDFVTTPEQPLGPFYPLTIPRDDNADLTRVNGRSKTAKGEIIIVKGVVQDEACRPIEGAIVEIWQACHTGKYQHPSDTSANDLDPDFQYYGQVKTNKKGEYLFKTILPGKYNATQTWVRPPHIHYKVSLRGYEELVTQLYFKGETDNAYDRILQDLNRDEQKQVIIEFKKKASDKYRSGQFDIKLKKL